MEPTCSYCGQKAKLVNGAVIYPHRADLHEKPFYQCEPCGAYVGCHPGTITPLGRLANAELRREKMAAHAAFDPLWKTKRMKRGEAYAWLAKKLRMKKEDCHIGMFDVDTCRRVVDVCKGPNAKVTGLSVSEGPVD